MGLDLLTTSTCYVVNESWNRTHRTEHCNGSTTHTMTNVQSRIGSTMIVSHTQLPFAWVIIITHYALTMSLQSTAPQRAPPAPCGYNSKRLSNTLLACGQAHAECVDVAMPPVARYTKELHNNMCSRPYIRLSTCHPCKPET